jgi:hypothetical protein
MGAGIRRTSTSAGGKQRFDPLEVLVGRYDEGPVNIGALIGDRQ